MKKFLFCAVFMFVFSPLFASDPVNFDKVKLGTGGGLGFSFAIGEYYEYYSYTIPTKIVLPIQIFRYFRLEPVLSLSFSKFQDNSHDGYEEEETVTNILAGSGIFFTYPIKSTVIVTGARIAGGTTIVKSSSEDSSRKRSRASLLVEPIIGADYFLSDNFSFGCEISLGLTYIGKSTSDDEEYENDSTIFLVRTGGTLYFRFYYF